MFMCEQYNVEWVLFIEINIQECNGKKVGAYKYSKPSAR